MQRGLPLLGEVSSEVVDLPWNLVAKCNTEQAAMRLCISQSRVYRSQEDLAKLLGYKQAGTLNQILNGDQHARPKWLSRERQVKLQKLCGNRAIDQWAELFARGQLQCQRSLQDQEAEILRQLKKLREEREKLEVFA